MNEFYIVVSYNSELYSNWGKHKDVNLLLADILDVKIVHFIKNNHQGRDLYKVILRDDDCLEFFILRTGIRPDKNVFVT